MATNYDELTKRRNEMALERYYRLKNGGSSGNNYNGIAMATPRNDGVTATQTEEKKNKGGLLGGLGYLGHELGLGVMRSIEGVVDYVGGGILDLFGADEAADELLKNDWVNYNAADEWYNPGKGWEFAGDVASGVGGMLPAVAVSFVPGVGGALSTATFGLGAAGQAVSEQTKKNGTASGKEWLYGTASGAMEAGIEAVSGGIGGTAAGKVLGKELAKTTGGKIATSFIGEGLEEVASDILDPALQRVTGVDKNAQVDWGNLPRTFLVGGATGAVMGGGQRALSAAQAGGFNNLAAAETAQEMDAQMSDNNVRQALGKKEIYTQKDMADMTDRLSQRLQKMDEGTRSAFLAQNKRIAPLFDADGTVKQSVWEDLRTGRFSVENQENMSVGNSQSIGNLSGETYSSSLKGRESTLKYQPATSTQGTENARAALRNIELLSGGRVDVVLTSDAMLTADGQNANGEYADGVLYVNANADSYQRAMFIASHELTHTLEGTEAYGKLGAFIRERVAADPALAEKYNLEKYRLAYENAQAGDFSSETLDYQAETEMYADFVAREILGNEDVVRRLVAKERNIAVRFLEWVRSALKRLDGSRETQSEYKALKKAEKLLSAALENAKGGVSLEEVEENEQRKKALRDMFAQEGKGDSSTTRQNDNVEQRETTSRYALDKKRVKGYNKDKLIYRTFPNDKESGSEANRIAVWWVHNDDVITGDQTLISYHDKWYIIEKFDDMPSGYQIVDRITESEFNEIYKEIIEGGRSGKIKPLQSSPDFIDQLDKSGSVIKERASSSYRISAGYGRKNQSLQQVDTSTVEGREIDGIRSGDNARNSTNKQGRFSLDVNIEEKIKKHYGSTYRWSEVGYIMRDGTRLDLSGRNEGARGGYRTVDHRDIFDIDENGDTYGTDALIEFVGRGNIRVMPENPGINLQVEPNEEQYRLIQDFVERVGWKEEYFSVDIDNGNGDTIETLTYEGKVSGRKVVADIKYYFKEGKVPYKSELSAFRYSIDVDSEGRELTKEQAEYFKDSKVRDKNGNLLVVYHGTADSRKRNEYGNATEEDFTVFNYQESPAVDSNIDGSAYFFTTNKKLAEFYAPDVSEYEFYNRSRTPKVYSTYLLMKNPYVVEGKGAAWTQIQDEMISKARRFGYWNWDGRYKYQTTFDTSQIAVWAKDNGYDGVIFKDIIDGDASKEEFRGDVYAVFDSNQIKSTTNENPTKNPDIRYSIDVEQSEKEKRESGYVSSLRNYLHRLNISEETKADVIEKYGERTAKRLFAVWENTTGREDGVDIVTAHKELWGKGFRTYSEYEEDFLADMDTTMRGYAPKLYEKAVKGKAIEAADENAVLSPKRKMQKTVDAAQVELTDKQTEYLANYTKRKIYTKKEAEIIINELLEGYMNYDNEVGSMKGKTREEVVKMMWRALNSADPGKRTGVARKIAEYIIQHTVMENIYSDAVVRMHTDTITALKPYLHNLNLDGIRDDIKYHYGNSNAPYALWGKKKGEKGIGVDVAAMELNENGFYIEEINPVDIFRRMDEAYRLAVDGLKKTTSKFATEIIGEKEQKELQGDMVKAILRAFDSHGTPSALSDMIQDYDKKVKGWKEKYYEERDKNNATARVLYKVQKLKDFERGTFANAAEFKQDIFKNTIGRLGRIKYRGNLNKSGTRKILAGLLEWYDNKNNPMLEGEAYNEDIAQMLMQLADNFKPLTTAQYELLAKLEEKSKKYDFKSLYEWYTRENVGKEYSASTKEWLQDLADPKEFSSEELKNLEHVVDYFTHFMENYNKVWKNGKLQDAAPIALKYVDQMQKHKRTKVGWFEKGFEGYIKSFGDPMTAARYFDKYEDGFFTSALEELRQGVIASQVMEQRMKAPLEKFYEKNKKFFENCEKRTIEYQGEKMNAQTAMLLYMTLKREQALRGLAYSGFKFNRGDEIVTVRGFATAENLDIDELTMQAAELQNELAKQFNEAEREYIAIVEKIFNEDCKKAKADTDMARMGYTNISEGYYVPIRRASIAYNVEKQTYREEIASVSDQSFNKDTVSGARNQLFIDGLTGVLDKHIEGISQYASLARALDNYNILFNLNVSGNPNMAISVKSEADNVWRDGGKYFSELIDDIKGVAKSTGVGNKFISNIRGGYAKYQLGANPKVWVTQLSSLIAAGNILDVGNIISGVGVGLGVKGEVLDAHCGLAMVRNNENTAAIAQGVLEKTTNKISDILMVPIGKVDRLVVRILYGAAQVQVEKKGGAKVGTEENLTAAGELLERVILETQQNAMATEKSAAMRSGNEIAKAVTMFSADSMKLTGRVIDAIGETAVLKARIKATKDADVLKTLKKELAEANKKACRALASVTMSAIFMTAIAEGFKWLYDKEREEDENIALTLAADTFGNMIGGLPFIRDVYSFFADGYEVESFAYASINDLLAALGDARDVAAAVIAGKKLDGRELAQTSRKTINAVGQLTGIPTRNLYNVLYGLTKRVAPTTAYAWNDKFYKGSYRADLAEAIEKGDDKMIATIVGLMLNENVGGVTDATAREAIDALVAADFDNVIPRSVPDKVTYKDDVGESVEIELTAAQAKAFEKIYVVANEKVAALVKTSQYKNASQEAQAKAIEFIYDTYYDMAKNNLTGAGLTKAALFAEAIDIDNLAVILAEARLIEADKKNGVTVSGTKKAKVQKYVNSLRLTAVQKYMIMGYLGYKNANGADAVKTYIRRMNLTNAEKDALYAYSGYGA